MHLSRRAFVAPSRLQRSQSTWAGAAISDPAEQDLLVLPNNLTNSPSQRLSFCLDNAVEDVCAVQMAECYVSSSVLPIDRGLVTHAGAIATPFPSREQVCSMSASMPWAQNTTLCVGPVGFDKAIASVGYVAKCRLCKRPKISARGTLARSSTTVLTAPPRASLQIRRDTVLSCVYVRSYKI